jgi:hypothetical protein
MTDEVTGAESATAAPAEKIVNFDAGETLGKDKIVLKRPFQLGGVIYREIPFREPTGADVELHLNSKGGNALALLTALTGLPVAALTQMYAGDFAALDRAVGKHL